MRRLVFLALLGCASASSPSARPPAQDRVILTDDRLYRSSTDNRVARTVVPAPRNAVWQAVLAVYGELGIDLKTMNSATGDLGNTAFFAQRSLGGKPMSNYLHCGTSVVTGPIANTHRIQMSILTTLRPDTAGTLLETRVSAAARESGGTSTDPVECSTTGRLEAHIAQRVMARIP